jgi:peptidyl-prolyl cis-trans isomerase SurA
MAGMIGTKRGILHAGAALALAFLAALAAAPTPARAVVVDGIAAVVNGEIITLLELEKAGKLIVEDRLRAVPAEERDRRRREVLRPVLDQLVLLKIQEQRARKLGLQVSGQEVDAAIENIMKQNHFTSDMLTRFLQERGVTFDDYRREIRDQIRLSKLVQQEIRSRVTVTREEIEKYYLDHQKDYYQPAAVRLRSILLPVAQEAAPEEVEAARQKALAILEEYRKGADFADLVRRHAPQSVKGDEDPISGRIVPGELTPALEEAAFSLPVGGASEPVRSPAGFHIVQVAEKSPALQRTLDELTDVIEQKLTDLKSRERYESWIKDLRDNALVQIRY